MKIVVLDAFTANPGDLSWQALHNLGDVTIYERTTAEQVVERAADAGAILINKVEITDAVMSQLPRCRYIGVLATGYNVVDIEAAHRRGITVTNVPAYSTASVAQMVWAHILSFASPIAHYSAEVSAGKWSACPDFSYISAPVVELAGKTIGIVGMGRIGTAVAKIAIAMGMRVVAVTSKTAQQLPTGVEPVSLEQLLSTSHIVTLHCPLTPGTRHLINHNTLRLMKPEAILINTGRGPLIDEEALADALHHGIISGAGLDVLAEEPPQSSNPLLHAPNCHITPHIAWASLEARSRLITIATANVEAWLASTPRNTV